MIPGIICLIFSIAIVMASFLWRINKLENMMGQCMVTINEQRKSILILDDEITGLVSTLEAACKESNDVHNDS